MNNKKILLHQGLFWGMLLQCTLWKRNAYVKEIYYFVCFVNADGC